MPKEQSIAEHLEKSQDSVISESRQALLDISTHIEKYEKPDRFHIPISGGKDSTALLIWAFKLSGYPPDQIRVSFCDTGNEHELTYEHVRYLDAQVQKWGGRPIAWLYPERDFYELAKHNKRFPSSQARFCTQYLKLVPFQKYIQWQVEGGAQVLLHTGVRASESPDRAALPSRGRDSFTGLPIYRPLLQWSIEEIWAIHERFDVRRNPLYEMGMSRVGCMPCIMSRKSEIAKIAALFPERIDLIRQAERIPSHRGFCSFFTRDKVPLRYRSKIITAPPKSKKGEVASGLFKGELIEIPPEPQKDVAIATIDDVVLWARSGDVEDWEPLDFDEEFETRGTCVSESGACE